MIDMMTVLSSPTGFLLTGATVAGAASGLHGGPAGR